MAPNPRTRLLYENDDVERVGTFEKQGACVPSSWSIWIQWINGSAPPHAVSFCFRLSYAAYSIRQRGACPCPNCRQGSVQPDLAVLPSRGHAVDRIQAWMRRRWLRCLHCNVSRCIFLGTKKDCDFCPHTYIFFSSRVCFY
jgi:hypothetical protein